MNGRRIETFCRYFFVFYKMLGDNTYVDITRKLDTILMGLVEIYSSKCDIIKS